MKLHDKGDFFWGGDWGSILPLNNRRHKKKELGINLC
jgi:hypothetical protein